MADAALLEPSIAPWGACEFRAMGSRCRIVAPDATIAERGRSLVDRLERSWTRFRDDSELADLNRSAGRLCLISPELHAILRVADLARELSAGLFDIRCLDAVEAAGYSSSWVDATPTNPAPVPEPRPVLGCPGSPVELFDDPPAAILPPGMRVDLGGIGKGFAADLVVDHLVASGAERVQVEFGGDIRVAGRPWVGDTWKVEVEDPYDRSRIVAELEIESGAVATSSVLRRRWVRNGVVSHHLVDPRTMRPAATDLVAVTAVATTTWRAEVAAKSALIAGRSGAPAILERIGARAVLVTDAGEVVEVTP